MSGSSVHRSRCARVSCPVFFLQPYTSIKLNGRIIGFDWSFSGVMPFGQPSHVTVDSSIEASDQHFEANVLGYENDLTFGRPCLS